MFENELQQAGVVVVMVETIVNLVKQVFDYNNSPRFKAFQGKIDLALSLFFSAGLAVFWNIDIFQVAGLSVAGADWIGQALTGLLIGVGSGIFHEVVGALRQFRKGTKPA